MHSRINSIISEPLSAVSFVQDYVEFHFDGKIVRSLTNPLVRVLDKTCKFPEVGSRDCFCSLIGQTVESVIVEDEDRIELIFTLGARLIISLAESERIGPEAAHFVPGDNQPIEVW